MNLVNFTTRKFISRICVDNLYTPQGPTYDTQLYTLKSRFID